MSLGKFIILMPLMALLAHGTAMAHRAESPPAAATRLTPYELVLIYGGKTWLWESGAGYMQSEGREFRAWSSAGGSNTYAEGKWLVTKRGQFCFRARWHTEAGVFRKLTCFSHRQLNGTIYQRRDPAGKWYIFKHADVLATDAINTIVPGDLAGEDVAKIKEKLENPGGSPSSAVDPASQGVTQ